MIGGEQGLAASMRPADQCGPWWFIRRGEHGRDSIPDDAGDGLGLSPIPSLGGDRIDAPRDLGSAQLGGSGHQFLRTVDALTMARHDDHDIAVRSATLRILLPLLRRSSIDDAYLVAHRSARDLDYALFITLNCHD